MQKSRLVRTSLLATGARWPRTLSRLLLSASAFLSVSVLTARVEAQCPFNASGMTPASAVSNALLFGRVARQASEGVSAIGSGSARTFDAIRAEVAGNEQRLDVNGSGAFDEVDVAIIARHLLGYSKDGLIPGGPGFGAMRKTGDQIQSYIDGGCVAAAPSRKKLSVMKQEQMAQNNGGVLVSVLDDAEIDQDIDLAWLEIQGTLTCSDRNLNVSSRWIIVHGGRLNCGTALNPFSKNLTITLTGPASNDVALGAGMGTKVLGVMHAGARLSLFGEARPGWTQLAQTADVGATSMTLKESMPLWRAGDKLVIAPSSFDAEDFDVVTISNIAGNIVSFTPALTKPHWGTLQSFDGKTLDQRAAVGLLSRNIVIQGDAQSEAAKFGGHIMSMEGASVQLSGVELRNMGQRGRFGRYPLHWHLAGDRQDDFLRHSSIHSSFQRAVVVHGTNKVTVEGNVAFDITNHAYVWAEDGIEVGNKFLRNLAVYNKNPRESEFAFPLSNSPIHGGSTQTEFRSGSFWGRSFNHTLVGNIAAGSVDGFGFFFDRFSASTLGESEGQGLIFRDNIAHSNYRPGAGGLAAEIYPEATFGHGLMVTTNMRERTDHLFERFTSYKNYGGAWLEDRVTHLKDSILSDNGTGIYVHRGVIDGVTIVGKSANTLGNSETPPKGGFGTSRKGAIVVPSSHGGARAPIVLSATIVNHDDLAYVNDTGDLAYTARVDQLNLINTAGRFSNLEDHWYTYDFTEHGIDDQSGVLSGASQPSTLVSRRSPVVSAACRENLEANRFVCPKSQTIGIRYENAPSRWTYLVEPSGATHGLGQPWTFDPMVAHVNSGWLKSGGIYEVIRDSNDAGNTIRIHFDAALGKTLELSWRTSAAASRAVLDNVALPVASTLAALRSASASAVFYDAPSNRLHLRLVGTASAHVFDMTAPFVVSSTAASYASTVGRAATPTAIAPGFNVARHAGAAKDFLRQSLPSSTPIGTTSSSGAQLIEANVAPQIPAGINQTIVFSGFVNAPVAGLYRISAPAIGGDVDVLIGNQWVTGSQGNTWTVPGTPDPNSRDEAGQIWLQAGAHSFKVIFGRNDRYAQYTTAPRFWLRWSLPGSERMDYVSVYR